MIVEGKTKLLVSSSSGAQLRTAGPGTSNVPVFYNPVMEFNRDISMLILKQFLSEKQGKDHSKLRLLDGLAGTGARGVRFGNEVMDVEHDNVSLIINDHNPIAYKLILKNIELNNLKNVSGSKKDLNLLLSSNRFDYIDIDPFGSPINFLDAGTRMLKNQGVLAITATDTATLYGSYPKTCQRRYDAISCRTPISHELGVRILLGVCVRNAAKHNLGLVPITVHATDHYYRLYVRGEKGRGAADSAIKKLGYFIRHKGSNEFKFLNINDFLNSNYGFHRKGDISISKMLDIAGPLWIDKLFDKAYLVKLDISAHSLGTEKQITKMLKLWLEESEAPAGFYEINKLASELKLSTPSLSKVIKSLNDQNFVVTRTHFNPNAFKTNASFDEITKVMKKLS